VVPLDRASVHHSSEQCACLVQLYFKYDSVRKCRRKFQRKCPDEQILSRQSFDYLVSKLKTTGSLLDKKPGRKRTVLTEETLVLDLKLHHENILND
jgi:hypothetical protein